MHDTILILDFGSQYTELIARRVREMGVYCLLQPYHIPLDKIRALKPNGIILSGSHESVYASDVRAPQGIFDLGIPVLGICYGMQTMAVQMGGKVSASAEKEFGLAVLQRLGPSPLLDNLNDREEVWMSHGDKVSVLPPFFQCLAKSDNTDIAAMACEEKRLYGLQFHPEVTHTRSGRKFLENFVFKIAGARADWTPKHIIEEQVQSIQQKVGKDHVILGLSGGVDSSVLALLLHRAIKDQLLCVFVDTGLLRLNEGTELLNTFSRHLNVKVVAVDAREEFYQALKGISDPEAKRKTIGRVFIEVFERVAKQHPEVKWLAQGTIYPDVIESAGKGHAKVIKSHHNVGGLPERLALKLLEPLRELFKDEVRQLGALLGLPGPLLNRHPFPGPGLGVRILGEIQPLYVKILQKADAIFIAELSAAGWYERVSQAFAVFLPVRSVGVMGDGRQYEYVIALRAVETIDFMTANAARLPYDLLEKAASRIVNEVSQVSRVTYDISGKPPATIEWE